MKKFVVTTFAILYGLLTVSLSAQRSFSHHPLSHNSHHFGKAERTDLLLYEKKLVEKELVADSPEVVEIHPLQSGWHIALVAYEYQPTPPNRPSLSRAPPFLF